MERPIFGPHPLEIIPDRELDISEKSIKIQEARIAKGNGAISIDVYHRLEDRYNTDLPTTVDELAQIRLRAREEHNFADGNNQMREAVKEVAKYRVKAHRAGQRQPRKLISQLIYRFAGLKYY